MQCCTNLSWQCLAPAALRCDINKRFLQNQIGEQAAVDFPPEVLKRIKDNVGRECGTVAVVCQADLLINNVLDPQSLALAVK